MKERKKFAFLIHPRTTCDLWRRIGSMLGIGEELGMRLFDRPLLNKIADWVMLNLPRVFPRASYTNCTPKGFAVNGEATGYIVAVLLTGSQMKRLKDAGHMHIIQERIASTILYAQDKLGVQVVGLGAYTAPLMGDGLLALRDKRIKCAITHGDSLSAAAGCEAVVRTAKKRNLLVKDSTIAVVGASGVVGRAMAIILSELNPARIVLIAHTRMEKLQKVKSEISKRGFCGNIDISLDVNDILNTEIVVLTTTAPGDIVTADMLQRTSVVVDMAQPHNMGQEVHATIPCVLRVDGGYMSIPKSTRIPFKMGPPRGTTFACLTETMVLALIGDTCSHVGKINVDFANTIFTKAQDLGFQLAPLTNFSKLVP